MKRSSPLRSATITFGALLALCLPGAAQDAEPAPAPAPKPKAGAEVAPKPKKDPDPKEIGLLPGPPPDFAGPELGVMPERAPAKRADAKRLVMVEIAFGKVTDLELKALCAKGGLLSAKRIGNYKSKIDIVSAPRLTVYDTQRATVSVVNQETFVRDRDDSGQAIEGIVRQGTVIYLRPTVRPDAKAVRLAMDVESAKLGSVGRIATDLGAIDVPHVVRHQTSLVLPAKDGERLFIGLPHAIGGAAGLLVVQATIVTPVELGAEKAPAPKAPGGDRRKAKQGDG